MSNTKNKVSWCSCFIASFIREFKEFVLTPYTVFASLSQPILYLFFFAPVLSGLSGSSQHTLAFFVPALAIQLGIFSGSFSGIAVVTNFREGVLDRILFAPFPISSYLLAKFVKESLIAILMSVLVFFLSMTLGFHFTMGALLSILPLVFLSSFSFAALSFIVANLSRKEDSIAAVFNSVLFPLILLAGFMVPISYGPAWLRLIAKFNPLFYVVEGARTFFTTQPNVNIYALSFVVICVMSIVSFMLSIRLTRTH